MARPSHVVLLLVAVVASCALRGSHARTHVVGSSFGWAYPSSTTFYQDWSNGKTFFVGDRVVFPYRSGMYTLVEVSKEDFPNCGRDNVVDMFPHGPVLVNLTEPGTRYFYCGVGLHCEAGMKVSINVLPEGASLPAPAPAPVMPAQASSATSIRNVAPMAAAATIATGLFMYVLHHALFM